MTLTENSGTSDDNRRPAPSEHPDPPGEHPAGEHPAGEHPDPTGEHRDPASRPPTDPFAQPPTNPPAQPPADPATPPPGDPFAQPPAAPFAQPPAGPFAQPTANPFTQPSPGPDAYPPPVDPFGPPPVDLGNPLPPASDPFAPSGPPAPPPPQHNPSQPPSEFGTPPQPPPAFGTPPSPFGPGQPLPGYDTPPPPAGPPSYGAPPAGPPSYGPPPGGTPSYGPPPGGTPSYGPPPAAPPGYGPPAGPPGYGPPPAGSPGYGPPPAGSPGYGPPPAGSPGYGPPSSYSQPGYGPPPAYGPPSGPPPYGPPPGYGQPGYGPPASGQPGPPYGGAPTTLPPEYYAGPGDPLVSPDFAGWWARSFRLLRLAWRPVLAIQLIAVIPTAILLAWVDIASGNQVRRAGTTDVTLDELVDLLLPFLAFAVVAGLLGLIVSLATQRVLVQAATARPTSIGAALLDSLRRTPALLGWGILAGLMIVVGLVFCIVPGIYLAAVFSILPVVVLLERGNAIGRVFQLFHADFGAALGRIATFLGLSIAFFLVESSFTNAVFPGAASGDISIAGAVASELLSAVFSVASGVALSPMLLTAYADMRARHEPFSTAYLVPTE